MVRKRRRFTTDFKAKVALEASQGTEDRAWSEWYVESFCHGMYRTRSATLNARSNRGLFLNTALKVLA